MTATLQLLRRSTLHTLAAHERTLLFALLLTAGTLRGLLVAFSPTPFGYVWDFYYEGVRLLSESGHLPASTECWQCYHPPLFYLLGWPLYAFGRWSAAGSPGNDVQGLRWLAGLGIPSAAITVYYGYRLLRLFRCRGGSLVAGVALLVTFPCLFISSYGAEADIVLTGILSAFIYYFTRDFTTSGSVVSALRLGVLAGLAAATKYSGLAHPAGRPPSVDNGAGRPWSLAAVSLDDRHRVCPDLGLRISPVRSAEFPGAHVAGDVSLDPVSGLEQPAA